MRALAEVSTAPDEHASRGSITSSIEERASEAPRSGPAPVQAPVERPWRRWLALEWLPPAARASVLFGLIGASLTLWAQMTFQAHWVRLFVLENQLDPDKRKILLLTLFAGFAAPLALSLGASVWLTAKRRSLDRLEGLAWFASPLIVAGALPILFRHSAWTGRTLDLLLATATVALLTEVLVRRALVAVPERVSRAIARARDKIPRLVRTHGPTATVWLGALGYSLFMSQWTIIRHRKLQSAVFDLGISDNLMANALAGEFMKTPVFSGAAGNLEFLAGHFQIGQYLFLPIYALHPSAETLLTIQSFALGLSAIPLYAFSRRRLGPWVSALVALGFLAYHPMHGANFYEMTYLPVACPFIMGTIWALDAGRYRVLVPLLVAALSMREDVSFGLAIVCSGFVLANHRRRPALIVALVSALYFGVVRFVIMPAVGEWIFPDLMYRELLPEGEPSSFGSVIKTLITNPLYTFARITTAEKLVFLLHLLVPLAFLPLRRAWLWLAMLPGIITTLLTTGYAPTISMGFHYPMEWAPYLWLAVPLGLAAIAGTAGGGLVQMRAALVALVVASAVTTFNLGAFGKHSDFPTGFSTMEFKYGSTDRVRYRDLHELVKMLPADASVAVMERVGAHATNRVRAYSMRSGPQGAEYILAGRYDGVERERTYLAAVVAGTEYGVFARKGEFAILKKGHDTSGNAALRADWGL